MQCFESFSTSEIIYISRLNIIFLDFLAKLLRNIINREAKTKRILKIYV
jgi:hypothetical protein